MSKESTSNAFDAVFREAQITRHFMRDLAALAPVAADRDRLHDFGASLAEASKVILALRTGGQGRSSKQEQTYAPGFGGPITNGAGEPASYEELREGLSAQLSILLRFTRLAVGLVDQETEHTLRGLEGEIERLNRWSRSS